MPLFVDRKDAGHKLAQKLLKYQGNENVLALGLPRGGIPVAYEVARELNVPMDIFLVRKLGLPGHEELAMGAIASGGICVLNEEVVYGLNIPQEVIDIVANREQKELDRREHAYRGDRPRPTIAGKTVVLVDDGLATGSSMMAAVEGLRTMAPQGIVVAVPVAPRETCERIAQDVDEIICLETPSPFIGVGQWYEDFSQTTDEEVRSMLQQAQQPAH